MAIRSNYIISLSDEDYIAADVFNKLYAKYKFDIEKGDSRQFYICRKFSMGESIDNAGSEVVSPQFSLDSTWLKRFHNNSKSNDVALQKKAVTTLSTCLFQISEKLGIVNLPTYKTPKKIKIRNIDEIKERLVKYKKRETYEIKSLREICPEINKTQTPSTEAGIRILEWLINDGKGRELDDVAHLLWKNIAKQENDKSFYVRRHLRVPALHVCHNEKINEITSILSWVLYKNPFVNRYRTRDVF